MPETPLAQPRPDAPRKRIDGKAPRPPQRPHHFLNAGRVIKDVTREASDGESPENSLRRIAGIKPIDIQPELKGAVNLLSADFPESTDTFASKSTQQENQAKTEAPLSEARMSGYIGSIARIADNAIAENKPEDLQLAINGLPDNYDLRARVNAVLRAKGIKVGSKDEANPPEAPHEIHKKPKELVRTIIQEKKALLDRLKSPQITTTAVDRSLSTDNQQDIRLSRFGKLGATLGNAMAAVDRTSTKRLTTTGELTTNNQPDADNLTPEERKMQEEIQDVEFTVLTIKEKYNELITQSADPVILKEVQRVYTDSLIKPHMDQYLRSGTLTQQEYDGFFEELNNIERYEMKHSRSYEKSEKMEAKVFAYLAKIPDEFTRSLTKTRISKIPYVNGMEKDIPAFLVDMAYGDLSQLRDQILSVNASSDWRQAVDGIFEESVFSHEDVDSWHLEKNRNGKFQGVTNEKVFGGMRSYEGFRASQFGQAVAGEWITEKDAKLEKIPLAVLTGAVQSHDSNILTLADYLLRTHLSPDRIAGLAFFMADSKYDPSLYGKRESKESSVPAILDRLTSLPDWSSVYSQALDKYPELAGIFDKLKDVKAVRDDDGFTIPVAPLAGKLFREGALYGGTFVDRGTKDDWRSAFGDEAVDALLSALPKATDERRNAFTHNKYDRTSELVRVLMTGRLSGDGQFIEVLDLIPENIAILTDYIRAFGLAKEPTLFHAFRELTLVEQGKIPSLSQELIDRGFPISKELLVQKTQELLGKLTGDEPFTNLEGLTLFEIDLLSSVTGRATHSHQGGPEIAEIIADFTKNINKGKIAPLLPEYTPVSITVENVDRASSEDTIGNEYKTLKKVVEDAKEGLESYGVSDLFVKATTEIEQKIATLQAQIPLIQNEQGQAQMQLSIDSLQKAKETLGQTQEQLPGEDEERLAETPDELKEKMGVLVTTLAPFKTDKNFERTIEGILEQIIIRNALLSSGAAFDFGQAYENVLQATDFDQSAQLLTQGYTELIDHATKLNTDTFWPPDVVQTIKADKLARKRLQSLFQTPLDVMKKGLGEAEMTMTGTSQTIRAIPDRGFAGEMGAYIANACYSSEYPILTRGNIVTPYKFVAGEGNEQKLVGSSLIFEVTRDNGEKALLVRPINIPNESQLNIDSFLEQFFDYTAEVGKKRGATSILIPGLDGAISNYTLTLDYLNNRYTENKPTVGLRQKFDFNGYDVTTKCYEVRTMPKEKAH